MKMMNMSAVVRRLAGCLAASAALLAGSARANTTINANGTFTINDTNTTLSGITKTWNDTGTLTMFNGATLETCPLQGGTLNVINNDAIVFAGSGGTFTLKFHGNDTDHMLNGSSITSTATGTQILSILTGYQGNGDRESVTFNAGIPNVGDGSALSLNVNFRTQTNSVSRVNLLGTNTFTGPITLVAGSGPATGYLTIGGTLTRNNGDTFGAGTLNSGNYAGAIALGASTIFNYASSSPQTLSGAISGAGTLLKSGSGTLTLSGPNTYSGSTTVNTGSLVLTSGGGLKFVVTNASSNKITGGGSATLNGTFTIDINAVSVTSGSWPLVNTSNKSFDPGTFNVTGFTKSGSVFTKVNGAQNWAFDTGTGLLSLSSKAIITSFGITGSTGVIDQANKTIALTVPYATPLATLAPNFTLTSGSCVPASGFTPSPTFDVNNTAHYIVTDGDVSNDYFVTVTKTAASSACAVTACNFGALGNATISGTSINLVVPVGTVVTNLVPTFTLSPLASISPVSDPPYDFSTPRIYRVTAENGSFQNYTISVQTYQDWSHSASLFILTTPDGANIPAGATENNFPLLVRLNSGNFDFAHAQSDGRDIRFAAANGMALAYQIEQWDAPTGTAAIWVKIPTINGNATQEIKMYWGNTGVASESNGAAVFNAENAYASVLHMNETGTVTDSVGTVTASDNGTTQTTGMIGKARNFTAGKGIFCGNAITNLPQGNSAHSTQAWFRSSAVNCDIVDWGVEGGGYNKVQIRIISPPRIYIDGNGASVTGSIALNQTQWHHVVHTYTPGGMTRIYVDGQPDSSQGVSMTLPTTSRMWIGGWYDAYRYVGDIDEVRVSKVARSANWIKLEYENQQPQQTLVGPPVQAVAGTLSATPAAVTTNEGSPITLIGTADGAQKIYWIEKKNGVNTVLATDQLALNFTAARVTGSQSYIIQFKGIYPSGNQTVDVPVTINEYLPDPVFTLTSPATWDGRQTITITPDISNLPTLHAMSIDNLTYTWNVAGVAVTKQITQGTPAVPGSLTLTRAQGSGPLTVTLTLDNGGALVTSSKTINVQEPATEAWVQRTPAADEQPVNKQFFARDDTNKGRIYYNGTQAGASSVILRVYITGGAGADVLYSEQTVNSATYAFTALIDPGLVQYKAVLSAVSGGTETVVRTATDLVCGDAYIVDGQSNAVADNSDSPYSSEWIRSYGVIGGGTANGWGYAVRGSSMGGTWQIGYWAMDLAVDLAATYKIPICIINGAVGGTRIDQHRANPADHSSDGSAYSIYANLLRRVAAAKLTHGIRAILWHQGENNSGADAPTGDYDYKSYQQYFVDMTAAWKQDYPNVSHYYVYQVWPLPCSMGPKGDQLREAQRTLPNLFSNLSIMSTLGVLNGGRGLCHFDSAGYAQLALFMTPLVKQYNYATVPATVVSAPNLQCAYFTSTAKTAIALEFNQDMRWTSANAANIYLDKLGGRIASGAASGRVITLQLTAASTATTITYLMDQEWNGSSGKLWGDNNIAALSFADVPIGSASSYASWAANPAQGFDAGVNDDPMDDPDNDGMRNQQEYAFGLNPASATSVNPVTQPLNPLSGRFQYTRRVGSGLAYQVLTSTDMASWYPDSGAAEVGVIANGDVQTVTVQVSAAPLNGKLFVRVRAH
jgi:autotransporter-associated beta strand protein